MIKDLIMKPYTASELSFEKNERDTFKDLMEALSYNFYPIETFNVYFNNDNSAYKRLDYKWTTHIKKDTYVGNKIKQVLVQTLPKYSLKDFIVEEFNFHIGSKSSRMTYSFDKFLKLSKMAVAMLFIKYGERVYECEIRIVIIKVLFTFFNMVQQVYGSNNLEWMFSTTEIYNVIDSIMNMSDTELKTYLDRYPEHNIRKARTVHCDNKVDIKKPRPSKYEDISFLWKDGMTMNEFHKIVQQYYDLPSERSAKDICRKLGFKRKYTIKNLKDDIVDAIEISTISINNNLDKNTTEVSALRDEINKLRLQIDEINLKLDQSNNKNIIQETQIKDLSYENGIKDERIKQLEKELFDIKSKCHEIIEENIDLIQQRDSMQKIIIKQGFV